MTDQVARDQKVSEPLNSLQVMAIKHKAFEYGRHASKLAQSGKFQELTQQAHELRTALENLPPEYRGVAQHLKNAIQILDYQQVIAARVHAKNIQKQAREKASPLLGGQS